MTAIKDRKPWVAALLNFAAIGLGHVYAGKLDRGILFYLISFLSGFVGALIFHFISNIFNSSKGFI
jgi:hypothetical protein